MIPPADDRSWRDMATAPRDGTTVELVCTYGVMPWYDLHRWDGRTWRNARQSCKSVSDEQHLKWRPTRQDPASYVDPTNGEQETEAYWRRGVVRRFFARSLRSPSTEEREP